MNWSGGVPVLVSAILNQLANDTDAGRSKSKVDVDSVAAEMLRNPPTYL